MGRGKRGVFVGLLDGTFATLSRTWLTSLLLGGVLLIPPAVLFGWAYGSLFDALRRMVGQAGEDPRALLVTLGLAYLWLLLAVLAQGLVLLFVRACVTEQTARAARGETAATLAATRSIAAGVLREKYARLLGQRVLQYAIVSITFAAAMILASVAVALGVAVKSEALGIIPAAVLALGGSCVAAWISIRYAVSLESLVVDGTGIDASLDASMDLVRGRWWRVFGYTLLFGLIVSFASSLVATPIMFFSTIRELMRALQEVLRDPYGSGSFNTSFLKLMAGIGKRFGILTYVQGLLACFVTPVFMTLLFLELKKPREPGPAPGLPPAEPASTAEREAP